MKALLLRILVATVACFAWLICDAGNVCAGIITFETIPGVGAPTDGMTISTQFQATDGVAFSLEGGGSPVLAEVGGPQTAFQGYNHLPDQPAPGVDAGRFFLTDDGVVGGPPAPFIVAYTNSMAAASGIILDIDGTEAWQVQARNALGAVIDTVNLGPNNLLDGSATPWSFSHASADIYSIRLLYTGSSTEGVGFAFDNFAQSSSPTNRFNVATPEPSSLLLFAAGALSVGIAVRTKGGSFDTRTNARRL